MSLRDQLAGVVVMGPMTKGSNLPYRRLCTELGARVLVSEMTVARRLKQKRRSEFALIRRFPGEPCFGVQLAGTNPEEMGWAAALVASRGADFVDLNLGCPIDHFTRKGLGAALARQPSRVGRIVSAMARGAEAVPVTVKIRLGWNDEMRNYLDVARAAVDAGAAAVFVHGRTGTRGIVTRPNGTRSARSPRRFRCRSSATATSCSRTTCRTHSRRAGAPASWSHAARSSSPGSFARCTTAIATCLLTSASPSTAATWSSRWSTGTTTSGDGRTCGSS